jgi:hypothetical protein
MYGPALTSLLALAAQTAMPLPNPHPVDPGTPIPDSAPAEQWRCTYVNNAYPAFAFTVQNGSLTRGRSESFALLQNNSIGLVATRSISQVALGKPEIGTYVIALDRRTGAFIPDGVFTAGVHNAGWGGTCVGSGGE